MDLMFNHIGFSRTSSLSAVIRFYPYFLRSDQRTHDGQALWCRTRFGPRPAPIPSLINDLLQQFGGSQHTKAICFADDLTLVVEGQNLRKLEENMGSSTAVVHQWSHSSVQPLNVNTDKTKALLIGGLRRGESCPEVKVGPPGREEKVQFVANHKILGLIIDDKLQFNVHCRNLVENVRKRMLGINFLAGRRWGPSPRSIRACFRGYVESKIRYGLLVYYKTAPKNSLKALQNVSSDGARKITGLHHTTGNLMARHIADIPSLDEMYDLYATLEVDRAMRVENSSLRPLVEDSASFPGGFLDPLVQNLEQFFPRGEAIRRFFPVKRGWRELFLNHGSIEFRGEREDRVETQSGADAAEAEADIVSYTDGSVTNPKRIAARNNLGGIAYSVVDMERNRLGTGDTSKVVFFANVGRFQHSFGTERLAFTRYVEEVFDLLSRARRCLPPTHGGRRTVVVFTDCLGLLIAMQHRKIVEAEDVELHRSLAKLAGAANVIVRHVSAHVGVRGNEEVDVAAKDAASSPFRHIPRPFSPATGSSLLEFPTEQK